MATKIQKWGNSQGLRINKQILEEANLNVGDEVDLCVREGTIIIEPKKRTKGKYTLSELVHQISADYKSQEIDWGKPTGKEVW